MQRLPIHHSGTGLSALEAFRPSVRNGDGPYVFRDLRLISHADATEYDPQDKHFLFDHAIISVISLFGDCVLAKSIDRRCHAPIVDA